MTSIEDLTSNYNLVWNNQTDYEGVSKGNRDISVNPGYIDPGRLGGNVQ